MSGSPTFLPVLQFWMVCAGVGSFISGFGLLVTATEGWPSYRKWRSVFIVFLGLFFLVGTMYFGSIEIVN